MALSHDPVAPPSPSLKRIDSAGAVAVEISGLIGLDPITVFWLDLGAGQGSVTITCWGCAWTAWFGAMGENRTIRQFFADAPTDYLVTKLGITPLLRSRRADYAYLGRIVKAIKAALPLLEARTQGPDTPSLPNQAPTEKQES